MKFGLYTLNPDGTIPDQVVSGGYFPVDSGLKQPQDLQMLGIVNNASEYEEVTDLKSYLLAIGADSWQGIDGDPFDVDGALIYFENMLVELEQELGA